MSRSDGGRARRHWLGLPPRVAVGFGAAVLSLAAAAVASFAALDARDAASRLVRHTAEAHFAVDAIERALVVSQTAIDGYVFTRDPRDRERYLAAWADLPPALARLQAISEQHPEEKPVVAEIAAQLEAVRSDQLRALALADAGEIGAARALFAGGAARGPVERTLAALQRIRDDEARAHEGREAAWNRSVRVSNVVFAAAVGVLLVLVLLAARLVRDEIRAREEEAAARERALLVQQRLMAVVSHDLRNPLAGILAAGWTLARRGPHAQPAHVGQRIVAAARRMERLIRDLLDWSRVHGGLPVPIHAREEDLHDVCRRMVEELSPAEASRVELQREGDTRALFDPDRMEQVICNLLTNALRYAPAETPVRIRAVGAPDEVRLEVHDEGPGIPPDVRAGIFEPFRQGPGGQNSGVGLGLFIARTLAEAQGGRIAVESAPGSTTFTVHLRRAAARSGSPPPAQGSA